MRRVAVLCEGQTEREFLSKVLAPLFVSQNVYIVPIVLVTKRIAEGGVMAGGGVNFDRVCAELPKLLNHDSVTTFFDLYAF